MIRTQPMLMSRAFVNPARAGMIARDHDGGSDSPGKPRASGDDRGAKDTASWASR